MLAALAVVSLVAQAFSLHLPQPRAYVTPSTAEPSYDFVIAGGGLAGLVLASRLSEDANTTVLVLEAGDTGDAIPSLINIPSSTYYNSLTGSTYDWAYTTAAQSNAGGRSLSWPRGKVLGGSSAINGMYLVRPSQIELDTWQSLISADDTAAAESWGWDSFYAALKKSENFTAPLPDVQKTADIQYTPASHGTSGMLHSSYPAYMVPIVSNWIPTLSAYGIPTTSDASSGSNLGAFIAQSAINPANWTRSYSKSAYIDPLPPRSNLHIMVNATVSQIVFANATTGVKATAVKYATARGGQAYTVNVNKELFLAGGAIGSPQMLMLSGVGPKDVLDAAGVEVVLELPGVGQHLQDHLSAGVYFKTDEDTQGSIHASDSALSQSAEFNSFINSATAYINGSFLFDASSTSALSFSSFLSSLSTTSTSAPPPSQYAEVIAGYEAIYNATANTLIPGGAGLVELLFSINAPGQVAIQAALQHPLSHGRVYITTADAFDKPIVDPQYFSHPADVTTMREGLKLARALAQTAPMKNILGAEVSPGSGVNTDAEWETWMRNVAGTEYHPTGSCAMLPRELGGVVNAKLQVYGTTNVRVIDASVYPFEFASHLGAPTYALAEQGASIIRAQYNAVSQAITTTSQAVTTTSSSAALQSTGNSTNNTSAGTSIMSRVSASSLVGLSVACVYALFL